MDELEDLHADQTNICFTIMEAEGEGWDPVKRPFQGGTFIAVLFVKCSVVFHVQMFFF